MWPVRSFINTYYCRRQKEESRSQLQQLGELFDEQISDTQQQLLDQVIIQFQSHEPVEGIIMICMEAPISPSHTDKCRIARLIFSFSFFCHHKEKQKDCLATWHYPYKASTSLYTMGPDLSRGMQGTLAVGEPYWYHSSCTIVMFSYKVRPQQCK